MYKNADHHDAGSPRLAVRRLSTSALLLVLFGVMQSPGFAAESALTAEQIAFFENKIRPALAEHCYTCHSAVAKDKKKLKGGLFLDTRAGVLTGGDTGPAIVTGMPDKSLLMTAVRWQDPDLQMPPKKKLPPAVVADFAAWIAMGAPDPRTGPVSAAKPGIDIAKGRLHWAFTPLAMTKPPEVKNTGWMRTSIDRFIIARQEAAGVTPNSMVNREKLIRRATFALIGLPPSVAEVAAFVTDPAPDAYEQLVDRLFANPAYGERWSRHWLDAVRYAESGGYEFDGYRPGAYHYRDWVIRALNADLPYDQFIREQIAGDQLKPGDFDGACATGFLVAGPYPGQITVKTKERIRYDQLDDMVATIGNSMLGLTLGCARCHDHKFDPLPQSDYYALAATLGKTEQMERKIDPKAAETARLIEQHEAAGRPLHEALKNFEEQDFIGRFNSWQKDESLHFSSPQAATAPWQSLVPLSVSARSGTLEVDPDGLVLHAGKKDMKNVYTVKALTNQRGLSAFRIDVFAGADLPNHGPGLSDNGNFVLGDLKIIARPHDAVLKAKPITIKLKSGVATFEQSGYPLSAALDNSPDSGWGVAPNMGKDHAATFVIEGDAIGFVGGTDLEFQLTFDHFGVGKLRLSFAAGPHPVGALASAPETSPNAATVPAPITVAETLATAAFPALSDAVMPQSMQEIMAVLERGGGQLLEADRVQTRHWFTRFDQAYMQLVSAVRDHERRRPQPELITIYSTKAGGQDVYLLRRGEVDNKDKKSEPSFLQVLADDAPAHWQQKSDADPRLGLSRWLTDVDAGAGRLLARVMVNRLWQHLFGKGLVATPDDFGLQGQRPSDPALLDHLAGQLIRGGWRLKPMLRQIMLSSVYQQGADETEGNRKRDPENKLWWQRPALRLEAEAIRDALLSVSERLDRTMFGPAIEDFAIPRRSIYLRVRRSELFPFMILFDAPEATQSKGDRGTTTQPTQALAMMNSLLMQVTAEQLSKRVLTTGISPSDAITKIYQIALSRSPTAAELVRLTTFFAQQTAPIDGQKPSDDIVAKTMTRICQVVLCLNEFIYVD